MSALPARALVVAATCLALTGGAFAGIASTDLVDLTGADTGASAVAEAEPFVPEPTSADPFVTPPDPERKARRAARRAKAAAEAEAAAAKAAARAARRAAPRAVIGVPQLPGYRAPQPDYSTYPQTVPTGDDPGAGGQPAPATPPAPVGSTSSTSFVISSFNVLGSSHTAGRDPRPSGVERIRRAATLLKNHGVDVAGLQELQRDQYRELMRVAGSTYDIYPGTNAGPLGIENSIIWRSSEWQLQAAMTVQIPYFGGRLRPMPYVLLRHATSGRMIWVANFHNPATNRKRGNNDRWRDQAAAIETSLAKRLWEESGYPVFVVGDMNDRERYFCRITAGAPMKAANGGSNSGGCRPPRYPMPVDWIFGSHVVTFSNYVRDVSALVRSTTDHPMIRATVTLDGTDGLGTR